jgi:hypothetical protein
MSDFAPAQLGLFDYRQLEPEVRAVAIEAVAKIRLHGRRAAESIVAIGHELLCVRAAMKADGTFLEWVAAEFAWKKSSACNFMNVAEAFPAVGSEVSFVDLKALYLLAQLSRARP